jgi:DNA polymerase III subunit alpha
MATPVHNHSEFSALDGFSTVKEIALRVQEINSPGAFLTDHAVIAGWRPFAKEMKKSGLIPGFGIEAYQANVHRKIKPENKRQRDQNHLILLAKNEEGVKNIMRMSDEANRSGFFYVPRIDWELLEKHKEGVIATSACASGIVAHGLKESDNSPIYRFLEIFGDDFFLELHTYPEKFQYDLNNELVGIGKELGIPMVYANDAHYSCKDDYPYHEVMLCMQMGKTIDDPDRMSHPPALYIMDEQDVRSKLQYLDSDVVNEAISNSDLILERCRDAKLSEPRMHLPVYVPREVTGDKNNNSLLLRLVEEGLDKRYEEITTEIEDRAIYEIETIVGAGLTDYFLITADFCKWADDSDIERGPGRGSAGGCLIAYALGITDVDPIKYDLYFERFYNAGRDEGLPDIDIDFEPSRRTELDDYLRSRYGAHHVVPIGNHIRMKPKAAIDKIAKVLGISYGETEKIKKIIDTIPDIGIMSADQIGWEAADGIKIAVLEDERAVLELAPYMDKHPELFDCAKRIGGRISNYGIHASAIVISDVDIREEMPTMFRAIKDDDGSKGKRMLATQIEMREVEECGFPKFDRLGLRNLDTLKMVNRNTGGGWSYKEIDWESLPEDFWKLIDKGWTLGLFQVEDGNAKHIGKRIKPRSILDLAAIVSLNRPGPLRSGVVDRFIARRNGQEDVSYPDPILEPILSETYGDFLYQEQVIAYFRVIGYDMKEADGIRKMLGKKLVVEMEREYPRYLERASEYMPEKVAERIWNLIVDFSKYSFNKSHAVAYAIILARTMYAKWKYPTQFFIASIQTNSADVGKYIREAALIGIKINPPDVNNSGVEIGIKDEQIWFGLKNIKWIGEDAAQWVIQNAPYTSVDSLREKHDQAQKIWEKDKIGKSPRQIVRANVIETLIRAGAFDSLEPRDISKEDVAEAEQELLGFCITDQSSGIIKKHEERLNSYENPTDFENSVGLTLDLPGIVSETKEVKTKRGSVMGVVKIDWDGLQNEFVVFSKSDYNDDDLWGDYKRWLLKPGTVGIFTVKVTERGLNLVRGEKLQ